MNAAQINAFRIAQGLAPLVVDNAAKAAQARRQAANAAKRAAESRELKSKRGSRSK
jgi:hypothetical protein